MPLEKSHMKLSKLCDNYNIGVFYNKKTKKYIVRVPSKFKNKVGTSIAQFSNKDEADIFYKNYEQ